MNDMEQVCNDIGNERKKGWVMLYDRVISSSFKSTPTDRPVDESSSISWYI